MGRKSKDMHTKHKNVKLPSASLKALPKAFVDPEDSKMSIATVTQNVEVNGEHCDFVYMMTVIGPLDFLSFLSSS